MIQRSEKLNRQILTVFSMYVGYACFMILKTAPIAASSALLDDPSLNLTTTEWGRILAVGTFGAILGKFISGWMADNLGGKFTFTLGLFLTAIAIALFAVSSNVWLLGFTFSLALMAKSAGWPSMAKIIGHWFQPNQYGRVWGIISTSSRVGTIIATLCLGALLALLPWRWMLLVAASLGGLVVLFVIWTLKEHPPKSLMDDDSTEITEVNQTPPHPLDGTTLPQAIRCFLISRRFWLITGSLMGLTILLDFLNFIPIYFKETLEIPSSQSSMMASAFPMGSFLSVLVGGYIFDKLDRAKMAYLMAALLSVATGCIWAFYLMPSWGFENGTRIYISIALLLVFGLCVSPCYYLPMSVFSIEFGGIHSGFLIALLDALAFSASMVFSYFGGELADSQGWGAFLAVLLAVSIWSVLTTFLFLLGEARVKPSET